MNRQEILNLIRNKPFESWTLYEWSEAVKKIKNSGELKKELLESKAKHILYNKPKNKWSNTEERICNDYFHSNF